MGNCLRNCVNKRAVMSWADEDEEEWGQIGTRKKGGGDERKEEEKERKRLLGGAATTDQVKIRISKKKLDQLTSGRSRAQVEDILAGLIAGRIEEADDDDHHHHHHLDHNMHWHPNLQTIPETTE